MSEHNGADNPEFAATYGVELLYADKPFFSTDKLLASIQEWFPQSELMSVSDTFISFVFKDHMIEYADGMLPAQIVIFLRDNVVELEQWKESFDQSWRWDEAQRVVAENGRYSVLVTDMMSSGLPYPARIELFQKVLYEIVKAVPCTAMHWVHSQQWIEPQDYLNNDPRVESYDRLVGIVNVRLYQIEGTDDSLMDTIGLGAIGLPDLQCHFHSLDANVIANTLYSYADYIYSNGDVIEDGNTIEGMNGSKWTCQHEISLLQPSRVVIDIRTGPYSAGIRE